MSEGKYRFAGFDPPYYTQVPDAVFDELLPELTGAELKVLLYIVRRTFGFHKTSDDISLAQLARGITTKEGKTLDQGTGLSKGTVVTALKGLVNKEIVIASRNFSTAKGDEPTTYGLRMRAPVSGFKTGGCPEIRHGGVRKSDPQETVLQETDPTYLRKAPSRVKSSAPEAPLDGQSQKLSTLSTAAYDEARQAILPYVEDFARELGDTSPLKTSVTRAANLYRSSGLTLEEYTAKLLEARAITKESIAKIKGDGRSKKRMAYFFGTLANLLKPPESDSPPATTTKQTG